MGEVMSWCGVRSLFKIVVQKSMCQGVMGVQVHTSGRRQVRESSLWPGAYLCEDPLQLKQVKVEGLSMDISPWTKTL
jgi:hypothetical protein